MGRIHRYGQTRDPVVIVNLIAGETCEGRVLKVLLDKLEAVRKQLRSDKVFDVVGRLFENMPLRDYLEKAATDDGGRDAVEALDRRLPEINSSREREQYRRLLPGYVRRFVEVAGPLIDLRLDGDTGGVFDLAPERPRAADHVRGAMDIYPEEMRGCLTVCRPDGGNAIWMHPGGPVFERFRAALLERCGGEALAVFPPAACPWPGRHAD